MQLKKLVKRKIDFAIQELQEANMEILYRDFENENECYEWLKVSDKISGFIKQMEDVFGDVNI